MGNLTSARIFLHYQRLAKVMFDKNLGAFLGKVPMNTLSHYYVARAQIFAAAVMIAFLNASCATMTIPEDKARAVESYELKTESRGLFVAVHPLLKQEIEKTFKTDLLKRGILPVLIVAENHSKLTSFVITKDNMIVVDQDALEGTAFDRSAVESGLGKTGNVLATTGAALGGLLPLLAGMKMGSDATVIQHNLGTKEFQSRTIDPGEKAHGYVYFQFPEGSQAKPNELHVFVEATDCANYQPITFHFAINYLEH